jgi:hypothetical protein
VGRLCGLVNHNRLRAVVADGDILLISNVARRRGASACGASACGTSRGPRCARARCARARGGRRAARWKIFAGYAVVVGVEIVGVRGVAVVHSLSFFLGGEGGTVEDILCLSLVRRNRDAHKHG